LGGYLRGIVGAVFDRPPPIGHNYKLPPFEYEKFIRRAFPWVLLICQ
jgi:hypothetical protein